MINPMTSVTTPAAMFCGVGRRCSSGAIVQPIAAATKNRTNGASDAR